MPIRIPATIVSVYNEQIRVPKRSSTRNVNILSGGTLFKKCSRFPTVFQYAQEISHRNV